MTGILLSFVFYFFYNFFLSSEDICSENLISCFSDTLGSLSHCRFSRNQVFSPFWGWWCPPWCPDLQKWRMCWRPPSWWCCTWYLRWCRGLRRWLWSSPLVCLPGPIQGRRAGSFLQVNINLYPKPVKTREIYKQKLVIFKLICTCAYKRVRFRHHLLMRQYH